MLSTTQPYDLNACRRVQVTRTTVCPVATHVPKATSKNPSTPSASSWLAHAPTGPRTIKTGAADVRRTDARSWDSTQTRLPLGVSSTSALHRPLLTVVSVHLH